MDSSLVGGLAAVLGVIVLALFARSFRKSGDDDAAARPAPTEPSRESAYAAGGDEDGEDDEGDVEFPDGPDAGHVVAVTSSGNALVPDGRVVRMLPPEESGEEWKVGAGIKSGTLRAEKAFGMTWSAGDLRGARVVRGAADEGAWVLETLGRDGEYIPFDFETLEAAEAAKQMFERLDVVQIGEDEEDGQPAPPSSEQFEEARRIYRETLSELSMDEGEEPR